MVRRPDGTLDYASTDASVGVDASGPGDTTRAEGAGLGLGGWRSSIHRGRTAIRALLPVLAFPLLLTHMLCFSTLWLWPGGVLFPKAVRGGAFTPFFGQALPPRAAPMILGALFARSGAVELDGVAEGLLSADLILGACLLLLFAAAAKMASRRKLLLLAPFAGWALVSLSQAAWPDLAWKAYGVWVLFAGSAIAAASVLRERVTLTTLALFLLAGTTGSLVTGLAFPAIGQAPPYWIGLFSQKNALGWFCAVAILVALFAPRAVDRRLRVALALTSLPLLFLSKSSTSLAALLGAASFGLIIRLVQTYVADARSRAAALAGMFTAAGVGGVLCRGVIAAGFGKDASFTGRTAIWAYYRGLVRERPVVGWGPGSFTGSPATWRVAVDMIPRGFPAVHAHSLYLTMAGEAGLVGLLIFGATLAYLAIISPAYSTRSVTVLTAVLAVAVLLRGVTEALEGFNASIGFLTMLCSFAARSPRRAGGWRRRASPGQGR